MGGGNSLLDPERKPFHPGHNFAQTVVEAFRTKARNSPSSRPSEQAPDSMLTQRETEILALLAEGLSNKEIAKKLHIAPETVKTHLQNIYRELDAKGRMATLKAARNLGLIPRD